MTVTPPAPPARVDKTLTAIADGYDDEGVLAESTLRRLAWRMNRGGKPCRTCSRTLPVRAYARDSSRADGLGGRCRECDAEARAAARARRG